MSLLMEINDLSFNYPRGIFDRRNVKCPFAINNVSIEIKHGHRYGLIGESTCGKTTFGKLMTLLLTKVNSGYIKFNGDSRSIFLYSRKEAREYRKRAQMIFQNPDASLNPGMKISASVAEAIKACPKHKWVKSDVKERVKEYLSLIKLEDIADKYPDILSGGEKRRISVIRALALEPDLVVADEPFSSLDASLRNEMLNLLLNEDLFLDKAQDMSYIFILHDLNIAEYICDTIAVMYMGRLVEIGQKQNIFSANAVRHPYTDMLILAQDRISSLKINQYVPQLTTIPDGRGCIFHNRCFLYSKKLNPQQKSKCETEIPSLEIIEEDHKIACHFRR